MRWEGFAAELGKYVLTGVLSFVAALVYTEFRLKPERNVSLVPFAIEKHDSCDVNHQNLNAAIRHLDSVKTDAAHHADDYSLYLRALSHEAPANSGSRWVVLKKIPPVELLPRLEQEEILICSHQDPNNWPDYRYNTFLVIQAAMLVNEPTAYVLKRSCTLSYEGKEIPLRASAATVPVWTPGITSIKTEPEILVIGATQTLFLQYDTKDAHLTDQEAFGKLVQRIMSDGKVDSTIKCTVIRQKGEAQIGGQQRYQISARFGS